VLVGTRFQATFGALEAPEVGKAIVAGTGDRTDRSTLFDIGRDSAWPSQWTGRALRNRFVDEWQGRSEELRRDGAARAAHQEAVARGDLDHVAVWAGEGVDLISDLRPAAEVVEQLAREAEAALDRLR
jgi:nitronate monooxygenase